MAHPRSDGGAARWLPARAGALARGLAIAAAFAACSSGGPPAGGTTGGTGVPDAGEPSCTGTPVPCEQRTGLDCAKQLGCSDHGACIGDAATCDVFAGEGPCTQHFGCMWMTGETLCTGGPTCDAFSDKLSCLNEPGCNWSTSKTGCVGSTDGCTDFTDQLLCASQMGCGWQAEACGGSPPIACAVFSSQGGCEEQPGCAWK
jgi:hypothetical protein